MNNNHLPKLQRTNGQECKERVETRNIKMMQQLANKQTWEVFWEACCDAHECCGQDQLFSSSLTHFLQFAPLSEMAMAYDFKKAAK